MKTNIVKQITNIVLPFIQVFALYVMVFGHVSPGGGFAGGSILGASLIMYRFINGSEKADSTFKYTYMLRVVCASLITYGLLKGSVFITSFFGMHSLIATGTPGTILSGGFILPLNILVGLVVAITFYFIATLFEEGELENAKFVE